jgi:hypothetical protein
VIDQLTQAFYPEDVDPGAPPDVEDLDRVAVRTMFGTLLEAVSPDGSTPVEVIVCDHAKLRDEPWFMDSVRYDWRGPDGLVPADWLDQVARCLESGDGPAEEQLRVSGR